MHVSRYGLLWSAFISAIRNIEVLAFADLSEFCIIIGILLHPTYYSTSITPYSHHFGHELRIADHIVCHLHYLSHCGTPTKCSIKEEP